jgi:hypothetical protein
MWCGEGWRRLPGPTVFEKWRLLNTVRGTQWRSVWGTALQTVRAWDRFPMVSLEFFIDIILPAALWSWGRLSLQQKWVPGIFPGGKDGWCVGLTTLPHLYADCFKIWEPQPPGTLRECQGLMGLLLLTVKEGRNIVGTIKRRESNWVDDASRRNVHLQNVIDGMIEEKRRRGRRKMLLDDLNDWECTGIWKMKL